MKWLPATTLALLLPSCAYVQTHKDVEEWGCRYQGGELKQENLELFAQDGKWYLSSSSSTFKKDYPWVHDSVFRRNDYQARYIPIDSDGQQGRAYFRISEGTAHVLQRADGYAELSSLGNEINEFKEKPLFSLAGATRYPIRAQIAHSPDQKRPVVISKREPEKTPLLNQVLGKMDFVVVDIPLTVAYNVAIPVMAPFVFFYEFSTED